MANSASGAPAATRGVSKCVNLALQGGGAHGAFSWGVIDALLACPDIEIVGLTGASAGAMNAVALADGLADGDRAVARATLERFWTAVTDAARASPIQRTPFDVAANHWSLDRSPAFLFFDLLSRVASPYDLNPLNINPLRDLVAKEIDFDRVRRAKPFVFVSATNVRTGRNKVFDRAELTVDHVMASACLPFLFQAVEIDGAPYWDGGYMGNPPIWPLFDCSPCSDVIVVQINPFHREETPRAARDILDRLNEITFNASLLRELRAYDFVTRLIADGRMEGTGYREAFIHMIADEATLSKLGASSKLNAEPAFIDMLFRNGRSAAEAWLEANFDAIGERSSLDLGALFAGVDDAIDGSRIGRAARFQEPAAGAEEG